MLVHIHAYTLTHTPSLLTHSLLAHPHSSHTLTPYTPLLMHPYSSNTPTPHTPLFTHPHPLHTALHTPSLLTHPHFPQGSAMYMFAAINLFLTYGVILMLHYLVCFILLVVIYRKLLRYIKSMRKEYGTCTHTHSFSHTHIHAYIHTHSHTHTLSHTHIIIHTHSLTHTHTHIHTHTELSRGDRHSYGTTGALLVEGQSKAKKRVLFFITVFVVNGFCSECTHMSVRAFNYSEVYAIQGVFL